MKSIVHNTRGYDYACEIIWPLIDVCNIFLFGYLSYYLLFDSGEMHDRYKIAMLVMAVLVVSLAIHLDIYKKVYNKKWYSHCFKLAWVWTISAVISFAMIYFLNLSIKFSRLWFLCTLFSSLAASSFIRGFVEISLLYCWEGKNNTKKIIIIAPSDILKGFFNKIEKNKMSYNILMSYALKKEIDTETMEQLAKSIYDKGIKEVWISLPLSRGGELKSILYAFRFLTIDVRFFPELTDLPLINHRVSEVAGLYAIDLNYSPLDGLSRIIKRLEDLLIGGAISILIFPLCILIALTIKLTSPGPVLFKQYRTGINGKKFKIYKFRSMKVHDETAGVVTQATKRDPRITKIGAFLRKTSLDELPQFFNVLQGRMSIVGPRPHALAHNVYYMQLVESYMQRHKVKPGITGWAQISGLRGETDTVDKMKERVQYDLWYIKNWSIFLDLKIIFMTIIYGFVNKNAY